MVTYRVFTKDSYVYPGDHIRSCLGEWWRLDHVTRGPSSGKPPMVLAHNERKGKRKFHASVFDLTVIEETQ